MAAGAPWSVKGIDPKAREIAKDLARRSGMTLGEWLNQVILEDGPAVEDPPYMAVEAEPAPSSYRRFEAPEHPADDLSRVTEALDRLSARIEAAEHRSTVAISGVDKSVSGLVSRLADNEREQTAVAARFEGLAEELKTDQISLSERLRRMEDEAIGPRSAEALHAMEAALGKVADHLYEGEARTGQQIGALREDLNAVADRVERGAAGLDAAELIEAVVSRVANRLEQAGARTSEAIRGLEVSFGHLDERLRATEADLKDRDPQSGLEQLAISLSAQVDEARAEMAEKIRASADGRFDRMDQTLAELNSHVQVAERRSAQAIERMGHEVMRMAETLGRKVSDVEHRIGDIDRKIADVDQRSAGAVEQVSSDVGRLATVMETRLTHIDNAGAQALEKLGGEIARITERLSERITNAERRSAQAIDDVGDQMSRVSERMQDRHERTTSDLVERMRQSEERTARLLEEARERIDQRLLEPQPRATEAAPPPPPPVYAEPDVAPFGHSGFSPAPLPTYAPFVSPARKALAPEPAPLEPKAEHPVETLELAEGPVGEPFGGEREAQAPAFAVDAAIDDLDAAPPLATDDADLLTPHGFTGDELDDASTFRPSPYRRSGLFEPAPARGDLDPFSFPLDDEDDDDGFLKPATDEAASEPYATPVYVAPPAQQDAADESLFARPSSTRELIEQARAAARASTQDAAASKKSRMADIGGSLFSGFGLSREKKAKRGTPLRTLLLLSGVVAAAGVSTAGYVLLNDKPTGAAPPRIVDAQPPANKPVASDLTHPMAAVALNPTPLATPGGEAPPAPNPVAAANGPALYEDGARRIEAHDLSGVDALRKAANLGYAPAEFYLAKLYEDGQAGLRKDLGEARVWTERAAESGDRKAMHNLALYYFEGTGGPKNMTTAAEWFRKAADLGLVDSQYNLARLYEKGFGVSQNPAEAYKWYLIAARSGDADSRQSAQQLKSQLSPQSQAAAERAAQSFQPQGGDAASLASGLNLTPQAAQATVSPDAGGGVANLQRALSRLGYYQGPTDGISSPALKLAIAAYQRDQGLPGTGTLDSSSEQLLYAAAQ